MDAIAKIFDQVAAALEVEHPIELPNNGPVNPPMLWNVPQHDKVQWDGLIPNDIKIGGVNASALGRNVGQAMGVFADVNITSLAGIDVLGIFSPGYASQY